MLIEVVPPSLPSTAYIERKLDIDEKPMRIFHDLKASRLDPIFTLKRANPASESVTSPTSILHSRPNSIARSTPRMPWSPLWTGANFEGGDLVVCALSLC